MEESYRFVQNKSCQYFPCHERIDPDQFNCLFCYCPLYMLQEECGGQFRYKYGVKVCTDCTLPHWPKGYDIILKRLSAYIQKEKEKRNENDELAK